MVKSNVQADNATFTGIRDFLTTYVTFPNPVQADICALWVIGTHILHSRFDAFGYMLINAETKRAGKSVLAECMSMVSRDGEIGTNMTAAVMRRLVARKASLFLDEGEALNSEAASNVRSYLNVGYRDGQYVMMPGENDEVIKYPAYGAKCFVLIGDPNDTLRDRSITITLRRAAKSVDRKIYRFSEAMAHAKILVGVVNEESHDSELTSTIENQTADEDMTYDEAYDFLDSRTAETFSPILALARLFCPARLNSLLMFATDIDSIKQSTTGKSFRVIREEAEANASDESFRDKAMVDLHAILHAKEHAIFSADAVERMKLIPTSPWRTYKGTGLTEVMLCDLVSAFIKSGKKTTKSVKIGGKTKRGFHTADIRKGFAAVSAATMKELPKAEKR